MMVVNYVVVDCMSKEIFINEVKEKLKNGYILHGGMCCVSQQHGVIRYMQAMIKETKG